MICVVDFYQYRKSMADKVTDTMSRFGLLKEKSYPFTQAGCIKMGLDSKTDAVGNGISVIIYLVLISMLLEGKLSIYWLYSYVLCGCVRKGTKSMVKKGFI